MEPLLQQLLSVGGPAGGLAFVTYLLLHERKLGRQDRAALIAEHRAEVAEQELRHEAAERDLERTIQRLRDELQRCRGGED